MKITKLKRKRLLSSRAGSSRIPLRHRRHHRPLCMLSRDKDSQEELQGNSNLAQPPKKKNLPSITFPLKPVQAARGSRLLSHPNSESTIETVINTLTKHTQMDRWPGLIPCYLSIQSPLRRQGPLSPQTKLIQKVSLPTHIDQITTEFDFRGGLEELPNKN